MHPTPLAPRTGGEPIGRGTHFSSLGCAQLGSIGERPGNQALANVPHLQAWLQSGAPVTRGEGTPFPFMVIIIRGSVGCALSDPSPRTCLPWVTLPSGIKPLTT
ncbi:hypothetical protein ILYODFUR_012607 [Ilyodon furcidens]|uniref:Uncharacterized protein n=1 Tax=Ilyodon furcidens TaxID=33524 RepID=A0ABV0VDS5_9TELE